MVVFDRENRTVIKTGEVNDKPSRSMVAKHVVKHRFRV
jgi:hypothetical protein